MQTVCNFLSLTDFCNDVADYSTLTRLAMLALTITVIAWAIGFLIRIQWVQTLCGFAIVLALSCFIAVVYGFWLAKQAMKKREARQNPRASQQPPSDPFDFFKIIFRFNWVPGWR